jgi:membrane-bound ClpP family serine protease
MIILGIILVVIGYLLPLNILITIGVILIVVGAILALLGGFGRTIGPRRHYW